MGKFRTCRVLFVTGAAALLVAAAGASFAGQDPAAAAFNARFNQMDANGDGRISREEYNEFVLEDATVRFDRADKNKDGYVTPAEAEQAVKEREKEIREKMRQWKETQLHSPKRP